MPKPQISYQQKLLYYPGWYVAAHLYCQVKQIQNNNFVR